MPDVDGLGECDWLGDPDGLGECDWLGDPDGLGERVGLGDVLVLAGDGVPLGLRDGGVVGEPLGDWELPGEGLWLGDVELVGDELPVGLWPAVVLGDALLPGLCEALLVAARSCARARP